MICRNCKKKSFDKISNIGKQPISSLFLKKKVQIKNYSLDLYKCNHCDLVQLSKIPNLKDMYGVDYGYKTSVSKLMVDHLKKKISKLNRFGIFKKKSKILDIGSNDGTFLNFFSKFKNKHELFGIDPSASAFIENYNKKINVIIDFFNKKNVRKHFIDKKIKFSLITSYAMFYDVEEPNEFCTSIEKILNKNGIWILEFSYFPLLLKNLTYDQICHEHCVYYSLSTFNKIISNNNLKIIDFSLNEINGGSIEVICAKKNSNHKSNQDKINYFLNEEKKISNKDFEKFNLRMENSKKNLQLFLKGQSKKNIIGYGASTKGNVILNYCKLNNKNISYICDANPTKEGKFTPGSHIKIISKNKMRKIKPKYLIVLIWSFRTEVIKQEKKFIKNGGKLIFPLPVFHVVDKENYKKYLKEDFSLYSFS
jgi:NDP-4-keto-2,6-dideoxyhexose 3-C-methyltransferase|tara:strand:- start:32 stop:1300 length:1269 start_codon:yes stop_codon:yes gene_type:complete